jgi:adenylate cyclase
VLNKKIKQALAAGIILVGTLSIVGVLSKYTPYLEVLELKNFDFVLTILRGPLDPPEGIAIVAIDETSRSIFAEELGFAFPWPRGVHAEMIRLLNEAGAKAVVFDVLFEDESDSEEDGFLAEAIRESEIPVILAAALEVVDDPRFSMVRQLLPRPLFAESGALIGYATLNPDRDGVLRHGRLFVGGQPTLSTRTLEALDLEPDYRRIPFSDFEGDDPEILVNYVGGGRTVPTASFYQALDYEEFLPAGFFRDRIVLVGYSLAVTDLALSGAQDHYPSPWDGFTGLASMPGVEIHANILHTLLTGNYLRRAGPTATWTLIVVLGLVISFLVLSTDSFALKTAVSAALILSFMAVAAMLLVQWNYWLYGVQPTIIMVSIFGLNMLYQYRLTERERAHIRRALSGYVSKQVMGEILKNPDQLELGGVQVEATVLFSDIAGFSRISEGISARELATLLNEYFTRMGDIIMSRDGMINKYIGDAVMAIWNAPLPHADHAQLACRAALEMKRAVEAMPPLRMRVGINTGTMVAGNLGHRERMEYTVIGDSVNLASRLEGANKAFGTCILISDTTEAMIRDDFLLRRVDRVRVVGKDLPVALFEVMAERGDGESADAEKLLDLFRPVIECYDSRDWPRAVARARRLLEVFPSDGVAGAYLDRCLRFQRTPPPSDWDGVYALEVK